MALSNREKDARHERVVAHYLEREGYAVDRGFYKFSYLNGRIIPVVRDLLGTYDIIAVSKGEQYFHMVDVRLIQVTAGGDVSARKKKAFALYPLAEVWEHRSGPRYRVHRRDGDTAEIDTSQTTYRKGAKKPIDRALRPGRSRG